MKGGRSHTSIITSVYKLETFGDNKYGQCGSGKQIQTVYYPFAVEMPGVLLISVECGDFSTAVCSGFKFFIF